MPTSLTGIQPSAVKRSLLWQPLMLGLLALLWLLSATAAAASTEEISTAATESSPASPVADSPGTGVEKSAESDREPRQDTSPSATDDPWSTGYQRGEHQSEPFSPTLSLFKAFGVLLLLIGLMVFVATLLKKLGLGQGGFGSQGDLIRIIETRSVGPKKYVAVVEAAEEFFLLGISDQQVNLLTRLENEQLIRQSQSRRPGAAGGFADRLAGAMKQRRERKD